MTEKDNNDLRVTPAALGAMVRGDLANAMVAMTPGGGIEAQEAAGQTQFVGEQTLPIKCPREQLEKLGFQFGDPVDDLFISVRFPNGWTKVPTEHSMWSNLVDDKGRVRGSIFYKAAFYDRHADMHGLQHRYATRFMPEDRYLTEMPHKDRDKGKWAAMVIDNGQGKNGTIIWQTEWHQFETNEERWGAEDKLLAEARTWLIENYPDCEDSLAYWD